MANPHRLDPKTGKVNGPGWFESTELEKPMTELPQEFNTDLLESHIKRAEVSLAQFIHKLTYSELLRHSFCVLSPESCGTSSTITPSTVQSTQLNTALFATFVRPQSLPASGFAQSADATTACNASGTLATATRP